MQTKRLIQQAGKIIRHIAAWLAVAALLATAIPASTRAGPFAPALPPASLLPPPAPAPAPALASPQMLYTYPASTTLVPLGTAQGAPADPLPLREAYKALFQHVYDWGEAAWSASDFTAGGSNYDRGTIMAPISGAFTTITTAASFDVDRSFALRPVKIALFYSNLRDEYDQVVTWEEGDFEQLFRVYLWDEQYFATVNETDIISGVLSSEGYDLLLLPTVRLGWADDVAAALGTTGLTAIREWVEAGGFLYAQGEANYLIEAAGLVPDGTVDLATRVTDADNTAQVTFDDPGSPLVFSWLDSTVYVLNEPLLTIMTGTAAIASFGASETTKPGSPAILYAHPGYGEVVLMNAHPSDLQDYYPQVLDAVLMAMAERAGIHGSLAQQYSTAVGPTVIPAYEAGVEVAITTTFKNYWDGALEDVVITDTLHDGFTTTLAAITPAPDSLTENPDGTTTIVWQLGDAAPGDTTLVYTAYTEADALASGSALVSTAEATYVDAFDDDTPKHIRRNPLYVQARMAARLVGDRDIELDGLYPLPAGGYYFDLALTLEDKEETDAERIVITDVVALLSPIVDVDDQRLIPGVLTDTTTMTRTDETLWAFNEFFFYHNADYLLPSVNATQATTSTVYNIDNWAATGSQVYTVTGPYTTTAGLTNTVTIPVTYTGYITLTAGGDLLLPAVVMVWDYGTLPGYDYQEPAVRYGLYSREMFSRTVSFASDPITTTGVILNASGGSVWTNLGSDPIPYHEYLSSGIVAIPAGPQPSRVDYADVWQRDKGFDLRTVFYDIVPFPPPEYHAIVNTTFDLHVDFDDDGLRDDLVKEYPSREEADIHLMLKSHSNFAEPLDLTKDETLISQGMFKGLGFTLEPSTGDWATSWSFRNLQGKGPDATVLTATVDTPAYTYLYFQQELDHQDYEVIDITGTLQSYGGTHREGVLKINDGARFVYHQKALGPSRYEVFDSHVQAVFGISSDAGVSKMVAPVRVATYKDEVYHFIHIKDPHDPRTFGQEPYLKSYGYGDIAITTYVGGRHGRELVYPRVAPGASTQIRLEINNNTGVAWTDVAITPHPPAGITVTQRTVTETAAIEPLFFDFPFLNVTEVPDAWKGVYYFTATVDSGITAGQVYAVPFTLSFNEAGSVLPTGFEVPPAMIGVDDGGGVKYTLGRAADLTLADLLPPEVTLLDARWGNAAEAEALEHAIITSTNPISIANAFGNLRTGISTATVTSTLGSQVSFTLPEQAQQMPWFDDDGTERGELYVLLRSRTAFTDSGTNTADYAPVITYIDHFDQILTDTGNDQTVEAHGAVLILEYDVISITTTVGEPLNGLKPDTPNLVTVDLHVTNVGDYIASDVMFTTTVSANVTPTTPLPSWITYAGGELRADPPRDLAPADSEGFTVTVEVSPTAGSTALGGIIYAAAPPAPGYTRLFEETIGSFVSEYPPEDPRFVQNIPLAGPLDIGPHHASHTVFLPLITKGYGGWWPQSVP